jgi:methionyl-tRNA formyltransferase
MRIVIMGTGTFAEPTFRALVGESHAVIGLVTQPDYGTGRVRGSTRQTGQGMKAIALEHRIPVFQPENINTPEGVAGLRAWQADLLVVAAYGQILAKEVLEVVPQGGINVHASLLPKYRGAAPVAWAIYHGETRTGVTIIKMSVHLDAGDILAQETLDIYPQETAGELEARLAHIGARLALRVIEQIAAGTIQGVKQDKTQATRAPKLTKEHGLIDWSRAPQEVVNQVRAMQPWPTAYTYLHRVGQTPLRCIVHKAIPLEKGARGHESGVSRGTAISAASEGPAPGDVVVTAADPAGLVVATGHGGLVLVQELQPAGKRRMSDTDFLRGHPLRPGDRFGPENPEGVG